jgi:hypothetical protein
VSLRKTLPRRRGLSVERFADKLRGRRRVGVSILHQCPCGERVSFIGLLAGSPRMVDAPHSGDHVIFDVDDTEID